MPGVSLTHVGGPTVLLEMGGVRILTDPTFDPPGRRYGFGWGSSSRKVAGPALLPSELWPVDVVLLTHDHHADNLDDAGRGVLADVPVVCTTRSGAARLGRGAHGLAAWETHEISGPHDSTVSVTATPCRHGPPLSRRIVGDVIGFAISVTAESDTVWFSGDTVYYDGVRSVARNLKIDVAVLHVGAVRFRTTGPLRYSMTIAEAMQLTELVGPRVAVPVHYEGWSHFSESEAGVRARLIDGAGRVRPPFRLLQRGLPTDLSA